ncbi:MAG: dehydrogenase [Ignavibacteria bacterium RIFOXYB2_FULL_35_12]|nr:MAG: dehydrogenase [Ignavibacteria bacterium GWA2_36_19]OGU56529.1 MAG: dehydrogenase [Ignavibacteria bacterium GWF2_35_20]OGU83292.1 MAG: dehydrogenase [Ignavibacteria bacterium RIFOXYA2_FULL_35_9]OGU85958.1 MAG: dehydrogenase [Ignavibacteria bacterium RIFOXYA12_FULL_35_25]OGU90735.1 MAG: dehydrogenase [Ignavibacteria bacterium RIFOXYC12_FULL_35_11]OGU97082.1 MAG: dehydrogenase [Ignavibacteria bacterium RIFOXYB12_FULL_35_14]OGU99920.1 MAG: dehydrogenase [Ignavibacteria bacterium RIFOXYC2_
MRKIKTAIIGSGFMGSTHLEALQRIGGVEVIALSSDDRKNGKALADKFSIKSFTENWKEVIANPVVEVIHNCTPNHLHFEINLAAIKNNKHIISEKPLTNNSKQSVELLELLKKHKVVNAINFNYRFYPLIQHAKSMVETGQVGDIFLVHGNYLQDWLYYKTDYNWRLENDLGGESRAIADIGSHWCDMVQFLIGSKIKKVFADLVTIHKQRIKPAEAVQTFKGKEARGGIGSEVNIKTEDAGTVLLHFENGARGVFTVSQVSAGRKNHFWFEIDGSKKSFSWNQENPNELWIGYREKPNEILIKDPSLLNEDARKYAGYPGGHPEGYPDGPKNLFTSVYNFIREGKDSNKDKPDFPTFEDGHLENKIVEAILKSNYQQKWISI